MNARIHQFAAGGEMPAYAAASVIAAVAQPSETGKAGPGACPGEQRKPSETGRGGE